MGSLRSQRALALPLASVNWAAMRRILGVGPWTSVEICGQSWSRIARSNTCRSPESPTASRCGMTPSERKSPFPKAGARSAAWNYDVANDALYVAGYPAGTQSKEWGLIGSALARYDGWSTGTLVQRWINTALPEDSGGYPPKSIAVAGDHIFLVATRERNGCRAVAEVLATKDGTSVGALIPPLEVGTGIGAIRTKDGRYHVAIEDNNGIRQHFVTWTPPR